MHHDPPGACEPRCSPRRRASPALPEECSRAVRAWSRGMALRSERSRNDKVTCQRLPKNSAHLKYQDFCPLAIMENLKCCAWGKKLSAQALGRQFLGPITPKSTPRDGQFPGYERLRLNLGMPHRNRDAPPSIDKAGRKIANEKICENALQTSEFRGISLLNSINSCQNCMIILDFMSLMKKLRKYR